MSLKKLIDSLRAIKETPQRIVDAWIDPVRRVHSISRILEGFIPAFIILTILDIPNTFAWAGLVVLGEFILYEWVLEPLGLTGYYWERGPRDDETFVRP